MSTIYTSLYFSTMQYWRQQNQDSRRLANGISSSSSSSKLSQLVYSLFNQSALVAIFEFCGGKASPKSSSIQDILSLVSTSLSFSWEMWILQRPIRYIARQVFSRLPYQLEYLRLWDNKLFSRLMPFSITRRQAERNFTWKWQID